MSEVQVVPEDGDGPQVVPTGDQPPLIFASDAPVTFDLDATGQPEGYVPTADGADGWAWAEQAGRLPDTGWRANAAPWITGQPFKTDLSDIQIRRVGTSVHVQLDMIAEGWADGYFKDVATLPDGFRPHGIDVAFPAIVWDMPLGVCFYVSPAGLLRLSGLGDEAVNEWATVTASFQFLTEQAWPDPLPGDPA